MRIGIAARGLIEKSGGVREYIENMAKTLPKIDSGNEYFIYYNSPKSIGLSPSAKERVINIKNKILWDYVFLPRAALRDKIDIMLFTKNIVPFSANLKSVVVNYDFVYFMDDLNEYGFFDQLYMRNIIPMSVKKADVVISISENTKQDIIKYTGVRGEKIKVIPLAASDRYKIIDDKVLLDYVRGKYSLYEPFIFHSGSLSPRKNIARLIKAFYSIHENIPHNLIFTAGKSWKDRKITRLIKSLKLDNRIIKLGHIPEKFMPCVYNLADLYVYPSLYEGFGLPLLEAMSCGCPVITSNTSSMPEVARDAALLINPLKTDELANAMKNVIENIELRNTLIRKGFENVRIFNWERTARETVKVFNGIAK